jgi:kinesin family member 5
MASSGARNGVGSRMSAKPDRQGAGATPKTAAGKHRLSSAAAGGGAYRRTSSGPLHAAAGGRAASDGGAFVGIRVRILVRRGLGGFLCSELLCPAFG